MQKKHTILTGVRVNEEPTIGNFLGAYTPMVNLSKEHADDSHTNFFVPDLHSFTTPIDHSKLYDQTIKGIKYYMAAGLDADNPNVHIYRQSRVPAHSELCWILDCSRLDSRLFSVGFSSIQHSVSGRCKPVCSASLTASPY